MPLTKILITNVLNTKTAFAQTENGQQVFIPSKTAQLYNVKVGEYVNAMLAHNTMNPNKTPWLAIKIERDEDQKENWLMDFIVHELTENGRATPEELADIAGEPIDLINENLKILKDSKHIVPVVCWDIAQK